jgi:hypothetical protein
MTPGGAWPPGESYADQAFAVAAGAYAATPQSWELAVHAAIAALFEFLADRPAETTACIADECGAGPAALARRDRAIDRFAELLQPGFAAAQTPPPVVAEAIAGGVYELVRNYVLERQLDLLPDAAADATVVALAPFMGVRGAIELVTRIVQISR